MDSQEVTRLAAELQRRAEEKFGADRASAMRDDVTQLARELRAIQTYDLAFEDEP